MQTWSRFVIYVNAYSAVQEAMDATRRMWERPDEGLVAFCRDANPFVWDGEGSFEEGLYEDFRTSFDERFEEGECTAQEGYELARTWLASLEGDAYGHELVSSLDETADFAAFRDACDAVARQVGARAVRLARTPQDEWEPPEEEASQGPSDSDIEAVIALLSRGDEAFAASLRARLAEDA